MTSASGVETSGGWSGAAGQRRRPPGGVRHWWPVLALAIVCGLYTSLVGLAWWIQGAAYKTAARSMTEHPGDEVTSLMAFVESTQHSLDERDRAVWALGQLADARALPVLERFHTGDPCDHATFLCQYQLEKAIARCSGRNRGPRWLPLFPRPGDSENRRRE